MREYLKCQYCNIIIGKDEASARWADRIARPALRLDKWDRAEAEEARPGNEQVDRQAGAVHRVAKHLDRHNNKQAEFRAAEAWEAAENQW